MRHAGLQWAYLLLLQVPPRGYDGGTFLLHSLLLSGDPSSRQSESVTPHRNSDGSAASLTDGDTGLTAGAQERRCNESAKTLGGSAQSALILEGDIDREHLIKSQGHRT